MVENWPGRVGADMRSGHEGKAAREGVRLDGQCQVIAATHTVGWIW